METEMIILVTTLVGFAVLGSLLATAAYCCVVNRRRTRDNNNDKSVRSFNESNSYIHYNSPRFSIRGKKGSRKPSVVSGNTENESLGGSYKSGMINQALESVTGDLYDLDIHGPDEVFRESPREAKSPVDSDNLSPSTITLEMTTCHGHGNVSTALTDVTNATTRTLHGTTTSLCEQCLSPDSLHRSQIPASNTEGTSTSLPATTVEVAKAALGMTNPDLASKFPIVCDSCLSPSKLGDTAKSLNLPNMRLLDLDRSSRKKVPPVGIITNPRMKNPHLNTLRDTMFEFNVNVLSNINERQNEHDDNSFDSLLSPCKTYDWLSGDPFGYSSGEESPDEDNEKMIKIQPQIKVRSARTQSDGRYFDLKQEKIEKERKMSFQDHQIDNHILEIELALQPSYHIQEDLTKMIPPKMFRVSSSKFPFGGDQHPIVAPPSPFRAIIDIGAKKESPVSHSKSCLMNDNKRQDSKTSLLKESIMNHSRSRLMKDVVIKQAVPDGDSQQNSPTSHLVWDSTFEAIKTLETSMKMIVTPCTNKTVSRGPRLASDDDQAELLPRARGSMSSVASTDNMSNNSSDHSHQSLAWDNSGDLLESRVSMEDTVENLTRELESSATSSVDIDEIVSRCAPDLSRCEMDSSELETIRPSKAATLGEFLERRERELSTVINSPLHHQTVYVSVTNLDLEDKPGHEQEDMLGLRATNQLQSSPFNHGHDADTPASSQLPSPIQFPLSSSAKSSTLNLNVPGALSLSSSPMSQLEDYLSLCSSMDSYKTILNDDSTGS